MRNILLQYGFDEKDCSVLPFGNGLINRTWVVEARGEKFILQKINDKIFTAPEDIAFNISLIANHLQEHHPDYLFVSPLQTTDRRDIVHSAEGYYRIFPFVKGAHTIEVVEWPQEAYEAAKQFAGFTKRLSGLDPNQLKITLPDFHNLALRYQQFEHAVQYGNKKRITESKDLIDLIRQQRTIAGEFEYCKPDLKIRCMHHDTKISNVLFDDNDKGLCVIDLDTVMPGYFISDVGDMMRTYLSPVNEEEKDFAKIEVRRDYYNAIVEGYRDEMGDELRDIEKNYFGYAGKFMIYMQALRFLTDHLNNDIYYGSKYEGHNFVRAGNQATLLKRLNQFIPH